MLRVNFESTSQRQPIHCPVCYRQGQQMQGGSSKKNQSLKPLAATAREPGNQVVFLSAVPHTHIFHKDGRHQGMQKPMALIQD